MLLFSLWNCCATLHKSRLKSGAQTTACMPAQAACLCGYGLTFQTFLYESGLELLFVVVGSPHGIYGSNPDRVCASEDSSGSDEGFVCTMLQARVIGMPGKFAKTQVMLWRRVCMVLRHIQLGTLLLSAAVIGLASTDASSPAPAPALGPESAALHLALPGALLAAAPAHDAGVLVR